MDHNLDDQRHDAEQGRGKPRLANGWCRLGKHSVIPFAIYCAGIALGLGVLFREFLLSDQMLYSNDIITFGIFVRSFLSEGLTTTLSFPQWNPYTCCGLPLVDAIHSGVFYPLTMIELMGDLYRAPGYTFILHYFLAGVFAYLAARQLKLSAAAAAVSGTVYMFAPCLISWTAPGHDGKLYVATLFPLVMLFLDRVLVHRRWSDVACLGLLYGVIILTPHLQLAYYVGWAAALICVYWLIDSWRRREHRMAVARSLALVATALVIALSVSAIQLLPAARYLASDSPRAQRQHGPEFAARLCLRAEEVISVALPEFCGLDEKHADRSYWGKNRFKDNSEAVGMGGLFLAGLALLYVPDRKKYLWATLAVGVLAYAVGPASPVHRLIVYSFPLADSMAAPSGSMFILVYAIAVLAGMMTQAAATRQLVRTRWLPITLIGLPVLLLLLTTAVYANGSWMLRLYCRWLNPEILPLPDEVGGQWSLTLLNLPQLQQGLLIATATTAVIALLLKRVLHSGSTTFLICLLPVVLFAGNFRFNSRFVTLFDQQQSFGNIAASKFISARQGLWRTMECPGCEGYGRLSYNRVYEVGGIHGKEPAWYYDFVGGSSRSHMFNPRVANLAGGRYVLCPSTRTVSPSAFGHRPLDTVFKDHSWLVLENHNCLPRAYLAGQFVVLTSAAACAERVRTGTEDLQTTVLLEQPPMLKIEPDTTAANRSQITAYHPDSVTIAVSAATAQLLVLTDNWYRYWHAYVDGTERPVLRAYGVFRAVEVPAGSHTVVFRYHSSLSELSGVLSLVGLAVAIFLFVASRLNVRR